MDKLNNYIEELLSNILNGATATTRGVQKIKHPDIDKEIEVHITLTTIEDDFLLD